MALPDVSLTIRDPGLGIVLAGAGKAQAKIGVCTKGTPNTVYSINSVKVAQSLLGAGPLVEAVASVLSVAGGPVYAVPAAASNYVSGPGSLTQSGSGAGTVSAAAGPHKVIRVKIHTGGTLTNMKFQVSIDGGSYGAAITSGAATYTYQVPGAYLTTLNFPAGTYVQNDVYTLNLDNTVTQTGSVSPPSVTGTHSMVDAYRLRVKITTAGALGTAAFVYSLDGGNSYSGDILTAGSGIYAIPDAGVVLTLASTFVKDDEYSADCSWTLTTTSDVTAALTALLADSSEWGWVHVVGVPASDDGPNAADAVTLEGVVDAKMTAAETAYRYVFGVVECPHDTTTDTDSVIKAAFANVQSSRIMVVPSYADMVSPLTGRIDKRPAAWAVAARLGSTKLSRDPGCVEDGALKNVRAIYRDEYATPSLDDARFTTLRTFPGLPGYYVTNGRLMSQPGSDFTYVMNRRVMDLAAKTARAAYLLFVNKDVNVDTTTGYIDEADAKRIDSVVQGKLEAVLLDPGECSGVEAQIARDDDLLSTSVANAEVSIVPKAYLKAIACAIGFKNPVLAQ
jgi:hypothetical protein